MPLLAPIAFHPLHSLSPVLPRLRGRRRGERHALAEPGVEPERQPVGRSLGPHGQAPARRGGGGLGEVEAEDLRPAGL